MLQTLNKWQKALERLGEGARWCEAGGVSPLGSNDGGGSGAGVSKDGRHSARVRKEGSVHEPITPTVRG